MPEVKLALKSLLDKRNLKYAARQENFDFSNVEAELGFILHDDLKQFYNSYYCIIVKDDMHNKGFYIDGKINSCDENKFGSGTLNVCVSKITDEKPVEKRISYDHSAWRAGEWTNDYRNLFCIGTISRNIDAAIIFDNNDGKLYWHDFGYGAEKFEDVPKGFLANSLAEFFERIE